MAFIFASNLTISKWKDPILETFESCVAIELWLFVYLKFCSFISEPKIGLWIKVPEVGKSDVWNQKGFYLHLSSTRWTLSMNHPVYLSSERHCYFYDLEINGMFQRRALSSSMTVAMKFFRLNCSCAPALNIINPKCDIDPFISTLQLRELHFSFYYSLCFISVY